MLKGKNLMVSHCPYCQHEDCFFEFASHDTRFLRCRNCDLIFPENQKLALEKLKNCRDSDPKFFINKFIKLTKSTPTNQTIKFMVDAFEPNLDSEALTLYTTSLKFLYQSLHMNDFTNIAVNKQTREICATKQDNTNSISVILPVFNEANTCESTINELLTKSARSLDIELIIVESNSVDGTREIVEKFRTLPNVKLIFQPSANGKGNAVREGLKHASKNYVAIYDGDAEYDARDFIQLANYVLRSGVPFLLGARKLRSSASNIRSFENAKATAFYMNMGHAVFLFLINKLSQQKMTDPFTMFKFIRRDLINNLDLRCNRFDLDIEIVMKVTHLGIVPVEMPSQYTSRGLQQGKKVTLVRDPFTWLALLVRLFISQRLS